MKRKYRVLVIFLVLVAVVTVADFLKNTLFGNPRMPVSPVAEVSLAYYKNANGYKWAIPTGEDKFTVASKEVYPRFVLGDINPVKVAPGDTQKMQLIVRDNVPLKRVWAEIENDKSKDTVDLTLGASTTVSYATLQNQKYLVSNEGKLVINDGSRKDSALASIIQSLFKKASAENAVDYVYSGSWVVHDTRTITYHTTFYAEDVSGRTAKLVLAWSDPCFTTLSGGNYLLSGTGCSLAGEVWGMDNYTLSLNGKTLGLSGGAQLVFNPGKSLDFTPANSAVTIASGTSINKKYLFYADSDVDGYTPATTMYAFSGSSQSGYVRVSSVAGTKGGLDNQTPQQLDCLDTNANVNPADTAWWAGNAQSGDYNCDSTVEKYWVGYNATYQTSGYPKDPTQNQPVQPHSNLNGTVCWTGSSDVILYAASHLCGDGGGFTGSYYTYVGGACTSGSQFFYGSMFLACR